MELGEHDFHDAVEQRRLAGCVPVEDHRVVVQGSPEAAHGQGVSPVMVDDLKRGGQHQLTGDLAVTAVSGTPCGWRLGHALRRARAVAFIHRLNQQPACGSARGPAHGLGC